MAAPTPATRGTPDGINLPDGFQTLIAFTNNLTVSFWEKSVQPPGLDGGDAIDRTTQHNVTYRTFTSAGLITLTENTLTVAYDPNVYNDIIAMINVEDTVTVTFPDGSTLAYYGYLKSFDPDGLEENTMPEASITIVPTNWDPANNVEAAPLMTEVSGT